MPVGELLEARFDYFPLRSLSSRLSQFLYHALVVAMEDMLRRQARNPISHDLRSFLRAWEKADQDIPSLKKFGDSFVRDAYLAETIVLALCFRVKLRGPVRVEFVLAQIVVQSVEFGVRRSDIWLY